MISYGDGVIHGMLDILFEMATKGPIPLPQFDDEVPKKAVSHVGLLGTCNKKVVLMGEYNAKVCGRLDVKVKALGQPKLTRLVCGLEHQGSPGL
ncbi:hypothetical protein MRX96_056785 [Rhipicephalus microplus]